jgi:hypothetical protein
MNYIRSFLILVLALAIQSCAGNDSSSSPPTNPTPKTFAFRLHGLPASEEFHYATSSQSFIALARDQLRLPEEQRMLFPAGTIAAGNGGYNLNWSWHFSDATLAETATEVCDGRPSWVESDFNYWLGIVGNFCPWSAYVYAEVQ